MGNCMYHGDSINLSRTGSSNSSKIPSLGSFFGLKKYREVKFQQLKCTYLIF